MTTEIGMDNPIESGTRGIKRAPMSAAQVREGARAQRAKAPEIARAKQQRRSQKADGGVHEVDRSRGESRAQEAAGANEVDRGPVKRWQRAHALAQLPDPPGYSLCWIARHGQHRGDDAGMLAAQEEGWEFVRREEFPKRFLPTQRHADNGQIIANASAVLMKLPVELKAQRDAYYDGLRDRATRQVTRRRPGLPEANATMPLVEDRNDVQTKIGRLPVARTRAAADA